MTAGHWPNSVSGALAEFTTESRGASIQRLCPSEADDLVASHDETCEKPGLPQELQTRERDQATQEMQVSGIVQRPGSGPPW